jgi:hypothetical protein
MASYSVSDAVSTYYLYMTYVHPFIFSLARPRIDFPCLLSLPFPFPSCLSPSVPDALHQTEHFFLSNI